MCGAEIVKTIALISVTIMWMSLWSVHC